MTISSFNHVKISGIKTVFPQNYVDIDDELEYFDNNPKKLARAKKMAGYGRRYIADDLTTVTDLAVDAAEKLIDEMKINKEKIELLVFVNQKPDYKEPNDVSLAHWRLGLGKKTATLDINMGCSGYVYALWSVFALVASGAVKNCLLLAGDLCARMTDQANRKAAPVFGDAASATFIEYTEKDCFSYFVLGADGTGWNKIIYPFGGTRLPLDEKTVGLKVEDANGNIWRCSGSILKGEEVFNFSLDVAPKLIKDTLAAAGWSKEEVDLFAIHQANKQIVENIIALAQLPEDKTPTDVFSKYANNSTNSVVTVLCDQEKKFHKVILCAFGIGLSWGGAALDLADMYNGGVSIYTPPENRLTREQQIENWIKYFRGED